MQIEAFSLGKSFLHPEDNEDSFIIIPGVGYAVIDGVTDHNGTYYGDMRAGRFAAQIVKRALGEFLLEHADSAASSYPGPEALVGHVSSRLREGYEKHGRLESATRDSNQRAGCAFTAAIHVDGNIKIVAIGDTGLRLNGKDVHQMSKPLDTVTSLMRREAWNLFASEGRSLEDCENLSAAVNRYGLAHQTSDEVKESDKKEIRCRVIAACAAMIRTIPEAELEHLISHGIAHGQRQYSNKTDLALGFGLLDGFEVPAKHIFQKTYPSEDIRQIELFSDGYFKCGEDFGVASWEKAFREVELTDPYKIGPYMSTKGSTPSSYTDDRTYLGIKL